ncbi:MAG: hypothetical protein JNK29_06280, partial [Anaerolineales bacterium]|nr:hypothetical protein [Anaerolineales bacterium]
LAAAGLLAALWAALVRLGWSLPALPLPIAGQHGALMTSGFLGTLIGVERAVALRWRPAYLAPALAGLGTLVLSLGGPLDLGRGLAALGALGLVGVFVRIIRAHPAAHTVVMGIGAGLWLIGNGLWWGRASLTGVAPWWIGFLVLTIAGERLELGRILKLGRAARWAFNVAVAVTLAGLALTLVDPTWGARLFGLGLLLLGAWLLWKDLARHTIRRAGLTRYIAASLLPGYAWLVIGGALWAGLAGRFDDHLLWDAALHSLLLGFVFSMIFGHAPIILPAVLGRDVEYRPWLYGPLALLHAALLARVAGDLAGSALVRQWAGLVNVLAVLVFLPLMAACTRPRRSAP